MVTARRRSTATVPRPSHSLRYGEAKGTTTDSHPMGANASDTVVTTCRAKKTMARSETRRCRSWIVNRGHILVPSRTDVRTPRATLTLSRTRATMPVARVVYHSHCEDVTAVTP
jgi:hypothetical protein